jgi:GTP-binding protein HflX
MIEDRKTIEAERAFLVGLYPSGDPLEPDLSLDELASLVEAAGGQAVGRLYQRRSQPAGADEVKPVSPATFIGRGKAEQVAALAEDHDAKIVVFDNELSPAQIRELEKLVGRKVIDRSELILDIFASRARTREAKLQVELAQLEYTAPRLRGMWTHLERQAGTGGSTVGLGMKGPGEKQIEIDRRIVKQRLSRLRGELQKIHSRKEREVEGRTAKAFTVGLVGYTNAGKSTLMNTLTGAGTYAADKLFATLDTKTRRWHLEPGADVALSDTVGFVRKLPHHLVASFRATLEEALGANLLLHVIDASHPQVVDQIEAVDRVLSDLGCEMDRVLPVLNKVDRIPDDDDVIAVLRARLPEAVAISARTGEGIEELGRTVAARRRAEWTRVRIDAPAGDGKVQAIARSRGLVVEESFDDDRWHAELEVPKAALPALEASPEVRLLRLDG